MNIHILTVPNEQIKERKGFTGADWFFPDADTLQIRVAQMSSRDREFALIVHELSEALLWRLRHGTDVSPVDEFDAKVEEAAPERHGIDAGDLPGCPYGFEHGIATACERAFVAGANIGSWREYDDELGAL